MDRGQLRLRLWPGADVGKPRPLDAVGEMADKPSSRGSAPTGGDAAPPPHSHRPWRVEGARPVPPATPAPPPPAPPRGPPPPPPPPPPGGGGGGPAPARPTPLPRPPPTRGGASGSC